MTPPVIAIFRGMLRGFCEAPNFAFGFRRAALCAQFPVILAAAVFAAQAAFFTHEAAAQSNVAADMTLRAEIEKTPPSLVTVRQALAAGANPNATVTGGLPLLFEAGRRGHAEIVSVLVTFGVNASVQVGQNYFPEYMAPNGLSGSAFTATVALPWRRVADVMIHFGDAVRAFGLTAGAAAYDWSATQGQYHVLVHLGARYNNYNPSPEEKRVMEAIGGYVLDQGAACPLSYADHPICTSRVSCPTTGGLVYSCRECGGRPNRALDGGSCVAACQAPRTVVNAEAWPSAQCECAHGRANSSGECPTVADAALAAEIQKTSPVLSSVRALLEPGRGADPNWTSGDGVPLLLAAARLGHAEVVSVLLTFDADPDARDSDNRGVPHIAGLNSGASAPAQLRVLRHFIGGLEAAGRTDSFNSWNAGSGVGRPLDALQNNGAGAEALAEKREIQALLYERGARCAPPADKGYCRIPAEAALIPAAAPSIGPVLTVTVTRRAFGGASFDLRLPDEGALAALNARGWEMTLAADPPSRVVVSRTQAAGGLPTVAVTMVNGEHAARQIRIVAAADVLPLFVTVVGSGSVSILAGGQRLESGSVPTNLNIQIIAAPDNLAYHVSGWSGSCADAPKGADGGKRACEFFFNGKDNRVTVTFSPGRLAPTLPATGNIPDRAYLFRDTGATELEHFCRLLGGRTHVQVGRTVCLMFGGGYSNTGVCDSPDPHGFNNLDPCGVTYFKHIRDCNAQNKPVIWTNACGAACDAAAGMAARGFLCQAAGDQCAAPFSPPVCDAAAACVDPDAGLTNTPAELCVCADAAAEGNGLFCGHDSVNGRLLAEVKKPAGAARVSLVLTLLGLGANASVADENGAAALILAATAGHAEIVSVLVTAGADVKATDSGFYNMDAVQHLATPLSDPAAGPRALRASVLRHFIGGLDVRNTLFGGVDFDWNREDSRRNRALDLLVNATNKLTLEGENVTVIYEMAGLLRERGARCGYRTSDRTQRVCVGSANVSLVTALSAAVRDRSVSAASVRAAAAAVAGTDIPLDDLDGGGGGIVAAAAQAGHAAAVSILLTFGVNPGGRGVANRGVLHIVGRNSDQSAPLQLRILRHFIGGLEVAGKADSFNGWNDVEDIGRPLDALHAYGSSVEKDHASKREMQALLYERGASCGAPEGKIYCQIPSEFVLVPSGAPLTGPVLTVTATRRAVGGTPFGFALPDAGARARLNAQGWEMSLAAGPPAGVVLSRTQAAGGLPTVAVTMLNGERAVRELRVALQSDFEYVEGDQCAAPFSPPVCDAAAVCVDPDLESANTPAELCVCTDDAAEGNGLFCGHESVNGRLLAEVKKPAGAARVSVVLTLLGLGANASVADENGAAALILAATAGHAEIVSVLVTAGADVKATDSGFYNMDAVQHLATPLSDPAAGPRALRASVLRHFIGGLDVRNTLFGRADFDWNREDSRRNRALDLLVNATNKLTLEGENVTVIYEMAGLLRERGARCGYRTSDRTQRVCVGSANVSLVTALSAAVRDRSVSAASVRAAAAAVAGTDIPLDDLDGGGGGIVAAAAQAGHAAAVSILLTFGVNPGGRGVANRGVLHIVGRNSDQSAPLQLRILRHFIGGLEVAGKADSFNGWNDVEDIGRPLDALHAYGSSVEGENVTVIYEMAGLLRERGARCGYRTSDRTQRVCVGSANVSLVTALSAAVRDRSVSAASVRAAAAAVAGTDIPLDDLDGGGGGIVAAAAQAGHAAAVSILLTFGVNPGGRGVANRGVLHIVGRNSDQSAPLQLRILRHFIGGLEVAGKADSFNGWNDVEDIGRPLDALHAYGSSVEKDHASKREMQALLYERGASCGAPESKIYCQIPSEFVLVPSGAPLTGPVLTVTATRRAVGGTPFGFALPDAGARARLNAQGWEMSLAAGPPAGVVLSRTQAAGGLPTVAVTMLNGERAVRELRVALQSDFEYVEGDQCAAPFSPPVCDAAAVCVDPDLESANTPAELCVCTDAAAEGNGLFCGHESVNGRLLAEVKKPAGAARVSVVLTLLGLGANASVADENGAAALILAATAGHAEIVSVLVTAGADVKATDSGFYNMDAVQHLATPLSDPAAGPRALRASVLRHFIGGLDVRSALFGRADFDWNREDSRRNRALDLLVNATNKLTLEGENVTVIYEMAGLLRERGARCGYRTSDRTQRVCVGSANVSLVTALSAAVRDRSVSAASVRAAAAAVAGTDIPLDDLDGGGGGIVAAAAQAGHAAAVSILLTFGVNPGGRGVANRGVLHIVGRNSDQSAPLQLRILRHFIGGLEVAGKADSFNGWNDVEDIGRPLDALHAYGSSVEKDHASKREMQALLYERGASCDAPESKIYCQIPWEFVLVPSGAPLTGPVLTVTATRRAVGGTPFGFALPDAGARARLNAQGWEMSLAAGPPAGVVLSRTQGAGGLPTVAVTMLNGERAVRELRVALQSDFEYVEGDQCAAPFSPPVCDAAAVCVDPDLESANTPAELCVCTDDAAEGNGLFCGHESVNGRLLAEVKKPAGAARVSVVLTLLGLGANASVADENGAAALILAATAGHAEIVSVLVTAGADVKATDSGFYNMDAVQHLATPLSDPAAGPRALRASVLRHFIGGLDVRNTLFGRVDFDWNREDSRRNRALDLLVNATNKLTLEGENVTVIYEMAGLLRERGARCGYRTSDRTQRVCVGSANVSLVTALSAAVRDRSVSAASVRAAAAAVAGTDIPLDDLDGGGGGIVAAAAQAGHAAAVSILLTFGVNPGGRGVANRGVLHIVGRNSDQSAPLQLRILRHFIGGLEVAGKADSFNGWNDVEDIGRPLEALHAYGSSVEKDHASKREMQALLYERGASCGAPEGKIYCQIPSEFVLVPSGAPLTGPVLTVTATRRAVGGTPFGFALPDAGARARLNAQGWEMSLAADPPAGVVLSRTQAAGGAADGGGDDVERRAGGPRIARGAPI